MNGDPAPANRLLATIVAVLAIACSPAQSRAQTSHPMFPVTDGPVSSVAVDGTRLYVAGAYHLIGPPNGAGAAVDTSSGVALPGFPEVRGAVYAAIADGHGGWYIGGAFDRVGDQPRTNLARIRRDLSVDPWSPVPDAPVRTMQLDGWTVYVGGDFRIVNGQPRTHVAALDPVTGALRPWHIDIDGTVRALVMHDGIACIGGDFTHVDSQPRNHLAGVSGNTGALSPWDPNADGNVLCLAVSGETAYVGGDFTHVSGVARSHIAAVSLANGSLLPWDGAADATVRSLAATADRVYVGGNFRHIAGKERVGIAALSACCAQALDWNPGPRLVPGTIYFGTSSYTVEAFALDGGRVYLGGNFVVMDGTERYRFAAFDTTTGELLAWAPRVNGLPKALAISNGRAYIGGQWSSLGGAIRLGLAAIDRATERVLPWQRDTTLGFAGVVAVHGGRVYTGSAGLMVLDSLDGRVLWSHPGNTLRAIAFDDTTVYAGGDAPFWIDQDLFAYALVNGTERWRRFAGPDPEQFGRGQGSVHALCVIGDRLYAGGTFAYVGDDYCGWGAAAIDPSNGRLLLGYHNVPSLNITEALAGIDGRLFAGAWNLQVIDLATAQHVDWGANPNVFALSVRNDRLYVGGRFTQVRNAARANVAAMRTDTGGLVDWQPVFNSTVSALAPAEGVVYAGGSFTFVNGARRDFLAAVDDTISTPPTLAAPDRVPGGLRLLSPAPNPFTTATLVAFDLPRRQRASLDLFDVSGRHVASLVASATLGAGRHEYALRGDQLRVGIYWVRLVTDDRRLTRKIVRLP